jgi:rare lipoprotein A
MNKILLAVPVFLMSSYFQIAEAAADRPVHKTVKHPVTVVNRAIHKTKKHLIAVSNRPIHKAAKHFVDAAHRSNHKAVGTARHPVHKIVKYAETSSNTQLQSDHHGTVSWYGSKFHGKKTASGQTYDMYAMTAAHNSLPLLSYAKVTNTKNHRSVVVRINDRGSFHGKNHMDLSYAAAKELGIQGLGSVEITPLSSNEPSSLVRKPVKPG